MNRINIENFKRVMDQIRQHPETWDQDQYACNIAFCVAGHALRFKRADEGRPMPDAGEMNDMNVTQIIGEAGAFLGLSNHWNFPWLYSMCRTLKDLEAVERGERDPLTGEWL